MPQDPFKVDQIQIEPGSQQTLKISRRDSDGALLFQDNVLPDGVSLSELAGLRSLPAVYVVAPAGAGAEYNSISAALEAASDNPALILVCPGSYSEDPIEIQRDGISIVGLGSVTISPNIDADTITLSSGVTAPLSCVLQNLIITNGNAGKACIRVVGGAGSTIGNGVIRILDCALSSTDAAGYVIRASSVNHILVRGGDWAGSHITATTLIEECASFVADGVLTMRQVQLDYDGDSAALPNTVGSSYKLVGAHSVGVVSATLENDVGSLLIKDCGSVGDVILSGNRSSEVQGSSIGDLTINGTSVCTLMATKHGNLAGDGSIDAGGISGELVLDNAANVDITFDVAQVDTDYTVCFESGFTSSFYSVQNKTVNGFRLALDQGRSGRVRWHVLRR